MSTSAKSTFGRKLVGLLKLNLKLENVTGLLIQMPVSAQAYRIGGADKYPIVTRRKYMVDGRVEELEIPFIPGSSLKGRMRALLELALGRRLYTTDGKIWSHVRNLSAMEFKDFEDDVRSRDAIDELFGWAAANHKQILEAAEKVHGSNAQAVASQLFSLLAPTRMLFTDFYPTADYVVKHGVRSVADFLEEKPENRIDRVTSAADPREVVRIKPGVIFEGDITVLLFDLDRDKIQEYVDAVLLGLELIEETYVGSSGSRGYGRVRFVGDFANVYKINPPGSGADALAPMTKIVFKNLGELKNNRYGIVSALLGLYR